MRRPQIRLTRTDDKNGARLSLSGFAEYTMLPAMLEAINRKGGQPMLNPEASAQIPQIVPYNPIIPGDKSPRLKKFG